MDLINSAWQLIEYNCRSHKILYDWSNAYQMCNSIAPGEAGAQVI